VLPIHITPFAKARLTGYIRYYRDNASADVAAKFRDEFRAACRFIAENPDVGSSRFAHILMGADLRTWSLNRYPFRIFYILEGDALVVLGIEHERRDVTQASIARPKRTH